MWKDFGGWYVFVMFLTADDLHHQTENGERKYYQPFYARFPFFAFFFSLTLLVG